MLFVVCCLLCCVSSSRCLLTRCALWTVVKTFARPIFVVAFSASPWLTGLALMAAGGAWMVGVTIFNIGVQTMSPRWVAGHVLAAFQTAVAGGLAIGSWIGSEGRLGGDEGGWTCRTRGAADL